MAAYIGRQAAAQASWLGRKVGARKETAPGGRRPFDQGRRPPGAVSVFIA